MKANNTYKSQADLLLDVLPIINQSECFAIKGGTAINMFIQNMPRLRYDRFSFLLWRGFIDIAVAIIDNKISIILNT